MDRDLTNPSANRDGLSHIPDERFLPEKPHIVDPADIKRGDAALGLPLRGRGFERELNSAFGYSIQDMFGISKKEMVKRVLKGEIFILPAAGISTAAFQVEEKVNRAGRAFGENGVGMVLQLDPVYDHTEDMPMLGDDQDIVLKNFLEAKKQRTGEIPLLYSADIGDSPLRPELANEALCGFFLFGNATDLDIAFEKRQEKSSERFHVESVRKMVESIKKGGRVSIFPLDDCTATPYRTNPCCPKKGLASEEIRKLENVPEDSPSLIQFLRNTHRYVETVLRDIKRFNEINNNVRLNVSFYKVSVPQVSSKKQQYGMRIEKLVNPRCSQVDYQWAPMDSVLNFFDPNCKPVYL